MNVRSLLMIRPKHFGFNEETAKSNCFQSKPAVLASEVSEKALMEFDDFVSVLQRYQLPVEVCEDSDSPILPDAVFPNNWLGTTPNGNVQVYPMLNPSRQAEVRMELVENLKNKYDLKEILDFRLENGICEGTGSLVYDHDNRLAYAVISPRTNKELVLKICEALDYRPVFVEAYAKGRPIYHTNVLMNCSPEFDVVCIDALTASSFEKIQQSTPVHKEIMPITLGQLFTFTGNMLAVDCRAGKFMIMSETAQKSLMRRQVEFIEKHREIVSVSIPTIEQIGGGSARCMLAEIF